MRLLALLAVVLALGTPAALSGEQKHDKHDDKRDHKHDDKRDHKRDDKRHDGNGGSGGNGGNGGNTPPLSPEQKAEKERQIKEHNAAVERQIQVYNATVAAVLRAQHNQDLIDHAWGLINNGNRARARSYLRRRDIDLSPQEILAKIQSLLR
jgi:hypothetical protein